MAQRVKHLPGNVEDLGSIPGLWRSLGDGNGNTIPVLLPGKCHGQRSLVGYCQWDAKQSYMNEQLHFIWIVKLENLIWISASGLPLWLSWERIRLQCGRPGFNPWVGKILWRRERLQYSDLENSMDCIVHGVSKRTTEWLSLSLSKFLEGKIFK